MLKINFTILATAILAVGLWCGDDFGANSGHPNPSGSQTSAPVPTAAPAEHAEPADTRFRTFQEIGARGRHKRFGRDWESQNRVR